MGSRLAEMKRRRVEKRRNVVVAWMNRAEWEQVVEQLYCSEPRLQLHSLHRLSAWRSRFGPCTPVAVETTANLVRCQVLDSGGKLEVDDLVLLYSMGLIRFVNLILERKHGRVAKPLRRLASNMNIPEWIVNLRHDMTHRKLPSIQWCRKGCEYVLNWLRQEFWSRQLSSISDWNSDSDDDEEENEDERKRKREEEMLNRQQEIDRLKKARELLISYERERFKVHEVMLEQGSASGCWPDASADLGWILTQLQQLYSECRDILVETLVQDGFLVPTAMQLESLNIDLSDDLLDPATPIVPQEFLQFWLPLLKRMNSSLFINKLLEKLFSELANEPSNHRAYYLSAWISAILSCNRKDQCKGIKKMKIFINRMSFNWNQLITACLNSPCASTPYLLQQILIDMDKPLPPNTQHSLLHLCTIYTQSHLEDCSDPDTDSTHPVYTVESLQEQMSKAGKDKHLLSAEVSIKAPPTQEVGQQLKAEVLQSRMAALHGSAWSVCTEKVQWEQFPLGKVPGQTDDPACLMVETYSSLSVFDQHVKFRHRHQMESVNLQNRVGSDGPLWTHSDLSKIKAGLQLF